MIGHKRTAEQIKKESDAFYNEIEGLKKRITEKQREKDPDLKEFAQMDKGETLDVIWFKEGSTDEKSKFIEMIQDIGFQILV